MQNDTRIAVDIAKTVFEVAVSDRPGRVSRCARLKRPQFLEFFAQQAAATVVMEACGSARYWLPTRGFRHGPEPSGAPS